MALLDTLPVDWVPERFVARSIEDLNQAISSSPKEEEMKVIAEELGWEELYSVSEPFRERFDEMCKAVEQLPESQIERGRELGYPQLHWACVAGDVDLVEALLKSGLAADAYTFTEDDTDEPPLVWLAQDGELSVSRKIEIAKVLLLYGADINEGGALAVALEAGDDEFAQFLQESGVAG